MGHFPNGKGLVKGSQELGLNPGLIFLMQGPLQIVIMEILW